MKHKLFLSIIFILLLFQNTFAQESIYQLEIGYKQPGKIDAKGFTLTKETTIKIEGYGGRFERFGTDLMFYGWILDGKTRKIIWNLLEDYNDDFFKYRNHGKFSFEKELTLPAGNYEVYYTAGFDADEIFDSGFSRFVDMLFNGNSKNDKLHYYDFIMTFNIPEDSFEECNLNYNVDEFSKNALIAILRAGNNEFVRKSFTVFEDVELNIRGIGEQRNREKFDFAWIVNSKNYETVWPNDYTRFKNAGGGNKNKFVSEKIILPKGDYTLYYKSDDSHSYFEWNVLPPFDPQFWGIAIWADDEYQNNVKLNANADHFVLKLNKIRNNDYLTQGFTLKKDMTIRIYSIGERLKYNVMADYGWIVNTNTHEKVWEFEERYSEYAGGAEKNRVVNEEISLREGDYIAYYVSDGSHSYNDWNDSPPLIPDLWGLNILVDENKEYFELVESNDILNKNIIAEITRVRDNNHTIKSFSLDHETKIRIYAIGEGDNKEMYDFGWIENENSGRVVWKMTSRNTTYAGGAEKNKLFDGTIVLPKGEYVVYFESDGSHSYRDWNSSPPDDQEHYGITIYEIK